MDTSARDSTGGKRLTASKVAFLFGKNMRTKKTTSKAIRPITVTITGELAESIREAAKPMGVRAATFAGWCIRSGELCTANTEEAREYRRQLGLRELAIRRGPDSFTIYEA